MGRSAWRACHSKKKSKGRFVSSPESSLRPVTCYILVCQCKLLTWLISGTPARGAKIKRALRTNLRDPKPPKNAIWQHIWQHPSLAETPAGNVWLAYFSHGLRGGPSMFPPWCLFCSGCDSLSLSAPAPAEQSESTEAALKALFLSAAHVPHPSRGRGFVFLIGD